MAMLDSGLALGRALGRPVRLIWRLRPELNCRFERLFEPIPGLARVTHVRAWLGLDSLRLRMGQWAADWRGAHTIRRGELRKIRKRPDAVLQRARDSRELRVRGDARFYRDARPYAGFRPVAALRERIEPVVARLGDAVGVHVRRGDHDLARRSSPLEGFVQAMRGERTARPGTRFFLATDDGEVRRDLQAEFGADVEFREARSMDRNDPRAIEDALVDLWCLAACRSILGSAGSTFSRAAWELRGIPHRVIDVTAP
jgi:hypothetical protein